MKNGDKTSATLLGLTLTFLGLAMAFALNLWGHTPKPYPIALVDPEFTQPTTFRQSYAELIRAKADLSDFDCYACHDRKKPPTLRFDTNQNLIIPSEHKDIVMGHGRHNRNNNCFNCHDEQNLELLQTRDGHEVKLADSPALCGSCHGPTYRDWEGGAHGRTGGFWTTNLTMLVGSSPNNRVDHSAALTRKRQICVDCHNPHQPKIPGRKPAPPPHPLRLLVQAHPETTH